MSTSGYSGYSSDENSSTALTASGMSFSERSDISLSCFLEGYLPKPPRPGFSPWTILPLVTSMTWFPNFFSLSARLTSSP